MSCRRKGVKGANFSAVVHGDHGEKLAKAGRAHCDILQV